MIFLKTLKIKKIMSSPPRPLPPQQGLKLRFVKLPTYAISASLPKEIHKNNTDTFGVTNKQHYKILF